MHNPKAGVYLWVREWGKRQNEGDHKWMQSIGNVLLFTWMMGPHNIKKKRLKKKEEEEEKTKPFANNVWLYSSHFLNFQWKMGLGNSNSLLVRRNSLLDIL